MRYLRNYKLFKEAKSENYSNKNIIHEICVSMVLLNNTFLDNILDRGLKARYSENSEVFLTDLKKEFLLNTIKHSNEMLKKYCDIVTMSEVKPFIVCMNQLKLSDTGRYIFENDSSFQTPVIDVINSMNDLF